MTITFSGSPNVYLPGAMRPNQLKSNDEVKLAHVDIGPNRFPFSAQNRYFDYTGFAYPASFQPGTLDATLCSHLALYGRKYRCRRSGRFSSACAPVSDSM